MLYDMLVIRNDKCASQEIVDKLPSCPICGAKAYLHSDTVDGFWFGWSVGCPRYCLDDGIHGHDYSTSSDERFAAHGFNTKEEAAKWWNERVLEFVKRVTVQSD